MCDIRACVLCRRDEHFYSLLYIAYVLCISTQGMCRCCHVIYNIHPDHSPCRVQTADMYSTKTADCKPLPRLILALLFACCFI